MKNYIRFGDRKVLPRMLDKVVITLIPVFEDEKEFEEEEYFHTLVDNMGANSMWLPFLLPAGVRFVRFSALYEVKKYYRTENGQKAAYCERLHDL